MSRDEEKVYGGCEGPDSEYVKLISSDGHEFIIKRSYALESGTIRAMLSGPGRILESETNELKFSGIQCDILQTVCQYLRIKARYANCSNGKEQFPIDLTQERSLELMFAASFLSL